jgi:hypothetical protein
LGIESLGKEFFMWEERFRRAIRLRLLALVLALALTWYALNPAPGPMHMGRTDGRETEPPDENRREAESALRASLRAECIKDGVGGSSVVNPISCTDEVGELEWPEIIDNV